MYSFKTGNIVFESLEEIPWTLDGEFGGIHDRVEVQNLNRQLEIMVPEEHIRELMQNPEEYLLEEKQLEKKQLEDKQLEEK